jgi:hypothetical protein
MNFSHYVKAVMEMGLPRPDIPVEGYIMMCLSLNIDPVSNTLFIIVQKDSGSPLSRRTDIGAAIAIFSDPETLLTFCLEELAETGLTMMDVVPLPLRACVDATDDEILSQIETVKGTFEMKSVEDTGDGITYAIGPRETTQLQNPFGPNVIGEA